MNYPNGNTVSEVKNKVSSSASKVGSEIKSEAKDLKSEIKSGVAKVEEKATETLGSGSAGAPSVAGRVLSSALSFLPVKSTDEAFSMLESTLKDVQSGMATARDSATSFVKKYPLYSLLGAAVIGAAAIALISSRKSSAAPAPVKYDA